jgi:hypothetical protein
MKSFGVWTPFVVVIMKEAKFHVLWEQTDVLLSPSL